MLQFQPTWHRFCASQFRHTELGQLARHTVQQGWTLQLRWPHRHQLHCELKKAAQAPALQSVPICQWLWLKAAWCFLSLRYVPSIVPRPAKQVAKPWQQRTHFQTSPQWRRPRPIPKQSTQYWAARCRPSQPPSLTRQPFPTVCCHVFSFQERVLVPQWPCQIPWSQKCPRQWTTKPAIRKTCLL